MTGQNNGALFKNTTKQGNQPDYTGPAVIDGVDYRMEMWISQGESGRFLSVIFKKVETERKNDNDNSSTRI